MDPERWKRIDAIIDAALELSESQRETYVDEHSQGDPELKEEVLRMMSALDASDGFMGQAALTIAAAGIAKGRYGSAGFLNKTIGKYRIERLIGAGGMGEVYSAFDEKLRRRIALKILPAEYRTDDDRVKRFEVEARAIASLNHPGIVTVFDVGHADGVSYIATEYVEGKTLRELIGGEFKIRNIVLNSIQICDALAAAHANGIIHRDIKPENIMIRKDGYAKILDFGLAKLTDPTEHSIHNLAATTRGSVIGTPAYMSPAQVTGDTIDHRTDLWSSGVVLYEFLTGKNPFKSVSRQRTLQAVLSVDPPPCSSLNPEVPPELDEIIFKLLQKDPDMGYQSAADLRVDLKKVQREIDSSSSGSDLSGTDRYRTASLASFRSWGSVAAAALLLAGLIGGIFYFKAGGSDPAAIDWSAAKSVQLTDQPGTEFFPSISPDGKEFVYAGADGGDLDIFLQRIGGRNRVNLTANSDSDDTQPAFSADGEYVAFRSERSPAGIYVMSVSGENLRFVSDTGFHPSWSPDGTQIVVSSFGRDQPTVRDSRSGALYIINFSTGERRTLAEAEASFPSWSPSGHRIAYWFYTGTFGRRDIATIPAAGGEPVVVAKDFAVSNWNPVWSPDGKYLYFVSSRSGSMNFWRVRIDETTGAALGEPEAVITPAKFSRHLTFSKDGKRLVYVQTNDRANIQGVDLDPVTGISRGQPYWITEGDRSVSRAELSPDGSRFVTRLNRPTQEDIVTVSRDGREWRDVTNDEWFERYVRWSPDGTRLAFVSDRNQGSQVWTANADGTNLKQLTFSSSSLAGPGFPVWSPDGSRVAIYHNEATLLIDPSASSGELPAPALPKHPRLRIVVWDWSPDGQKLAGVIAEGEKRHIGYFDIPTNEYRVVVENNSEIPSWTPDSSRLVYSMGSKVFQVDINGGAPKELFNNPLVEIRSPFVSRDGKMLYYTASNTESDIWLLDLTAER